MSQTASKTMINDMTEGPLTRQLILFALPIMGANLLQALYTLVDLWAVGNFADSVAISAVSISGQIVYLIHCVGIGLSNGGQVLIAQQVGAKETKRIGTTIGTLLTFCILASCVMAVIGAVGCNLWTGLLNTPEEAMTGAVRYLLICCLGTPFMCICGTMCAVMRGMGESKQPMCILGVAAVANMILDFVFVAWFGWGASGAAWATILAQVASAIYAVGYTYLNRDKFGFDFRPRSFRMERKTLGTILKLGTPLVIMSAAVTLSMAVISAFINAYGVAASAITGIGSKLFSLVNVVTASVQTAVGSVVAQNFAAGKMDRVRKATAIALLMSIAFFAVLAVLCIGFPTQIVGIFTNAGETEVLALAPNYMWIMCWMYAACCLMSAPTGHINGVGFTSLNLVIALLDGVVGRIGISLFFGYVLNMGVEAYWWGNCLAAYISVIFAGGYYFFGHWEKRKALL